MTGFHYKYIKIKYDKAEMLFTDTDSFVYIIG